MHAVLRINKNNGVCFGRHFSLSFLFYSFFLSLHFCVADRHRHTETHTHTIKSLHLALLLLLATVLLRLLPMGPAPVRATPPCSSSSSSSCVRLCFFLFFLVSSLPRSHFAHDDFFSFRFTPIFVSCFFLHFFLVSVSFLFVHDDGTGDGPAYTPSSPAHFLTTRNGEENRKETNRQQEPNTATTNKRKPTVLRLTPAPPPHTHT